MYNYCKKNPILIKKNKICNSFVPGEQNKPNATVGNGHIKPPKKVKKDKEKIPISTDGTPVTNDVNFNYTFLYTKES